MEAVFCSKQCIEAFYLKDYNVQISQIHLLYSLSISNVIAGSLDSIHQWVFAHYHTHFNVLTRLW
jgi:hypothetical protein